MVWFYFLPIFRDTFFSLCVLIRDLKIKKALLLMANRTYIGRCTGPASSNLCGETKATTKLLINVTLARNVSRILMPFGKYEENTYSSHSAASSLRGKRVLILRASIFFFYKVAYIYFLCSYSNGVNPGAVVTFFQRFL